MRAVFNERELEEGVNSAHAILIVTRKNPDTDDLAASLALYLALKQVGKTVIIACPDSPTVEFGNLFGVDKITNELGSKAFIISLDYKEGSIEKVSYNIEGDKFNLVIQPKTGSQSFSEDMVRFSHSGTSADLIFVVGCQKLEDLDKLFTQEQEIYSKSIIVNVDTGLNNSLFGKINIVDPTASSKSEIVAQTLKILNITTDQDCAANILTGILWATDRFLKGNIKPETFEVSARCLRAGAKMPGGQDIKPDQQIPFINTGAASTNIVQKDEKGKKLKTPPTDWLEPKIYKGSTLA